MVDKLGNISREDAPMIKISSEFTEEIPQWDVALEALLREEYDQRMTPLTVDDVHRLAVQYGIRFDDLMATLVKLTVEGRWRYMDAHGEVVEITQEQMDELWAFGRVEREFAVAACPGSWQAWS